MVSFLFWNIRNNPIQPIIANLALRHEVDVIMLAECSIPLANLLSILNESADSPYYYIPVTDCKRIKIISKFQTEFFPVVKEEDKFAIRHLKPFDILISMAHLPSKLYRKNNDQIISSVDLSKAIRESEEIIGHQKTILFGDLNMNPYEDGIIMASGLNGTMSKIIAQERIRRIGKRKHLFFYNPMWNFLGDYSFSPPGTYYYRQSAEDNLRWYIYDQVLIRPDLLANFDICDLRILISDGDTDFLSGNGIPRKDSISDHLPLLFKLNI